MVGKQCSLEAGAKFLKPIINMAEPVTTEDANCKHIHAEYMDTLDFAIF